MSSLHSTPRCALWLAQPWVLPSLASSHRRPGHLLAQRTAVTGQTLRAGSVLHAESCCPRSHSAQRRRAGHISLPCGCPGHSHRSGPQPGEDHSGRAWLLGLREGLRARGTVVRVSACVLPCEHAPGLWTMGGGREPAPRPTPARRWGPARPPASTWCHHTPPSTAGHGEGSARTRHGEGAAGAGMGRARDLVLGV